MKHIQLYFQTPLSSGDHMRLDKFLTSQLPDYSRTHIQSLIEEGQVQVNGAIINKTNFVLKKEASIIVTIPEIVPLTPSQKDLSAVKVDILFTHDDFFIINKPAGLVTHAPHPKSDQVTLVDWLVTYCSQLKEVGDPSRPGIVHRLDKDTSGIMIIPRNSAAHMKLSHMFKERFIKKSYLAVVEGRPKQTWSVDYNIARHPTDPKMTHIAPHGRQAFTQFTVVQYFANAALVKAEPITGRTHQIRVHAAASGHPIIGDATYGTSSKLIARHALHAHTLSLVWNGKEYHFEAPLPDDMKKLIEKLS